MNKFLTWLQKNICSVRFWLVTIIVATAAFLRLYNIMGYMTFLGDEGRDALVVYKILHSSLTFLGPRASAADFYLGPIYYYFMAPFLWLFNYNPVGPAIMVALFGIATVWFVYKIGKEFFNTSTGIIASFLYAISPLVISYSRSSWNPNPMPFFSLLTLYFAYKAFQKKTTFYLVLTGFCLGIAIQLHYLALFLGFIVACYVLLNRLTFKKGSNSQRITVLLKDYTAIFVGFVIGWSPFLLFEIRHSFPNLKTIFNFVFYSGETGNNIHFFTIVQDVFFRMFGRFIAGFPPPEQISFSEHINIEIWYYFTLLIALGSCVILLWQWYKTFNKRNIQFQQLGIVVIWFFLGIVQFGFYKKAIYDYYFSFMFPAPFLIVGNALSYLWSKKIISKIAAGVVFAVLVCINLRSVPFLNAPNRQLAQVKEISEFVLSKSNGKPFNFALITGGNSDHGYRYFFTIEGHEPVTILNPQTDPQRKSVTDQLLIVCETNPCAPLGNPLWEVAGFGRAEIAGEWNVSVLKVYKLIHYKGS